MFSVGKFTSDNACAFKFISSTFIVKNQNKRVIAKGLKRGQLYALDGVPHEALSAISKGGSASSIWHQRLGHPHSKLISFLKDKNVIVCFSCQIGKCFELPFNKSNIISKFPLDKIHCDHWGPPAPVASNQSFRYYAIFIDDSFQFTWLYPLKRKSNFLDCFINF